MLLAHPQGYQMVVTYLHRNHPDINTRSMPAEIVDSEDIVHKDLTRILNLEMKLTDPLEYEILEEDSTVRLQGQAVMYPGIEPYIGDLFYLEIDHNNIHLFRVNEITPTTYRQERYYRISFVTFTKATPQVYELLNDATINTQVFDKKAYFGSSEYSLLAYDSFLQLQALRQHRRDIAQDITNFYYRSDLNSYMRPDEVYDPYVTEFLRKKLTVDDDCVRAVQLFPRMIDYHRSIWYKLLNAENRADFRDVYPGYAYKKQQPVMFDTDITGICNKMYVALAATAAESPSTGIHPAGCTADSTYVFGTAFYAGDRDAMDMFSRTVYDWLTLGKIDVVTVLDMVERYRNVNPASVAAFYTYPVYIDLIDAGILSITR